eukprot:CAMPEP_0197025506 /NCGR_PEP_ID=MMETSP1384-20130603/5817_1 /TAXON_ID=29189 /ORGANISM="Ammonia sp." /LENGTH=326 /DNA_ID=CAMNT_0042454041 /DNA_START=38 /DNA_END=1018 /DNA_ORIENTATION=+
MQSKEEYEYQPIKKSSQARAGDDEWDKDDIEASDDEMKRQETDLVPKTKWKSSMFKVERESQPSGWQTSDYYKYRIFVSTKWFVVPLYLLFGVATIVLFVLYFIHDITKYLSFGVILAINIVGGVIGALMTYKFGTVEQVIDFLQLQNNWYDSEMDKLSRMRQSVATDAKAVHFSVNKLKSLSKDLDEQYQQFEGLRMELEQICKENESMQGKLDDVTKICNDIEVARKQNERAHLLSIYYETLNRSKHDYITREDYAHLLGRLNQETRQEIEMQGGFDSIDKNHDGQVDIHEFQDLVNVVLQITEDKEASILRKLTQLNYTGTEQ